MFQCVLTEVESFGGLSACRPQAFEALEGRKVVQLRSSSPLARRAEQEAISNPEATEVQHKSRLHTSQGHHLARRAPSQAAGEVLHKPAKLAYIRSVSILSSYEVG